MVRNRTMPYGRRTRAAIDYENHPVFSRRPPWRRELHRIIFGHLTPAGKLFDIVLIIAILSSVAVVMVESVEPVRARHGSALRIAEWCFTVLFTVEYALRLVSAERPGKYARTFFGIVDLLAILPTYLSLIVPGGQALAVIRVLRVLRVFRVLKLAQFVGGERLLIRALRQSAYKITVFLIFVLTIVVVVGAVMYFIEGRPSGFTSIPTAVYWAIVTLTTVGFGDITPHTPVGQFLAAMLMVLGYAIIAVPTGIVSAEMVSSGASPDAARPCPGCSATDHGAAAAYCQHCGTRLPDSGEAIRRRKAGGEAAAESRA